MSLFSDKARVSRASACLLVLLAILLAPVSALACGLEQGEMASCCCAPSHGAESGSCESAAYAAAGCGCQMSPAQPASPATQAVAAGGLKAPRLAPQFALAEMVSLLALDAPRVVPQRLSTPVGPPTPVDQFFRINC